MIHTPYHFVPLSDWVYMPDWAHLVSHDMPFADGYSGSIEYTLTNATPLCVGAEQQSADGKPTQVFWARDPKGNPVIPGSSIKGMLRSVLEIASFGKFQTVDNQHFSYRDMASKSHYLQNVIGANSVESGWVKFNNQKGCWEYRSCQFVKLKYKELEKLFSVRLKDKDSAVSKYKSVSLSTTLFGHITEPRGKQQNRWVENLSLKTGNDLTEGHVVFTNKKVTQGDAEHYEFCYFFHSVSANAKFGNVTELVNKLFHSHDEDLVNYLKQHCSEELGIPVFLLFDKQTKRPHSMGLAKMPRVSYKNSVHDLVRRRNLAHFSEAYFDMAELIFGTLREGGLSLRSRVSFSDLALRKPDIGKFYFSKKLVLNNPKATFYPAYIEHAQDNAYSTYDNANAKLKGWKRYISKQPLHAELAESDLSDKDKVACLLELLPKDQTFSGKLVFHNLKAAELGALLWLLDFEKDKGCYHSLGHGKPFGAGAIQLNINNMVLKPNMGHVALNKEELKQTFISEITQIYSQWAESPQIRNLLQMAKLNSNAPEDYSYMPLNSFQTEKNVRSQLLPFNKLPRQDGLKHTHEVSFAFGKGRLASLIDQSKVGEQDLLKLQKEREADLARLQEKRKKEVEEQAKQDQREQALAQLSPGQKEIELLREFLSKAAGADKPPRLRATFQDFLEHEYCQESALALYRLARENDFHKTPAKKVPEHKKLLADLVAKYSLKL